MIFAAVQVARVGEETPKNSENSAAHVSHRLGGMLYYKASADDSELELLHQPGEARCTYSIQKGDIYVYRIFTKYTFGASFEKLVFRLPTSVHGSRHEKRSRTATRTGAASVLWLCNMKGQTQKPVQWRPTSWNMDSSYTCTDIRIDISTHM